MKTSSLTSIPMAVLAAGAIHAAQASDTYVAPSVDLAKVCRDTGNKSGAILNGKDFCEISTDGGSTWLPLAVGSGGTLLLGGLVGGGIMLRNKQKKTKEAEEQARIAEIAELETSNPELHGTHQRVQDLISKVFPGTSISSHYNANTTRINSDFTYNKKVIHIGAFVGGNVVVFQNNSGYNSNGSWNAENTGTRFAISHLQAVLESIRDGAENPPAFQESTADEVVLGEEFTGSRFFVPSTPETGIDVQGNDSSHVPFPIQGPVVLDFDFDSSQTTSSEAIPALDEQIQELTTKINDEDTTSEERGSAILKLIGILSQDPGTIDGEKTENITTQISYLDTCLQGGQAILSENEKVQYGQLLDIAIGNNSFSDEQKETITSARNAMNQQGNKDGNL